MKILYLGLVLILLLLTSSCTEKYPEPGDLVGQPDGSGCVNCHTNADLLKKVAIPLPPPSDGGTGEG